MEGRPDNKYSSLSLETDYNLYRSTFRNDMEASKAAQITEYNLYKQKFRTDMQSAAAPVSELRAPQMILASVGRNQRIHSLPSFVRTRF